MASEEANGQKNRTFSYIKPLGMSMGPKQTKCICTEMIENWDLENSVSVLATVSTPDVPNGNIFIVKARYCMTWAENNSTRMVITTTVEWSGKSWIKGPIEKGAQEGQVQAAKELSDAIKKELQPRHKKPKKKSGKKRGSKTRGPSRDNLDTLNREQASSGLIVTIVQRIMSMFRSFTDGSSFWKSSILIFLCIFFALLIQRLLFLPSGRPSKKDLMMKWNTLWELEERDLWIWMEDRVDYESDSLLKNTKVSKEDKTRVSNWLSRREVEEGIATTQMRLDLIKSKLQRSQE